ncbi:MAG TPA: hypothetical protein PKZ84_14115 [Anaerolineae bacterium]|nr:hypothetical protein [Anaerolineae bacterium]HQI85810.1 hypothetical protein [Anaerolineae bacterium]
METHPTTDEKSYHYPWARALMIVVLYGALLIFLWHFPTPGGRAFFQALFRGFLYIFAGLALVLVTIIFFMFFPLPPQQRKPDEEFVTDDEDDDTDEAGWGGVFTARSLLVPAFKNPEVESRVWDILYDLEGELNPNCVIAADARSGIITITDGDVGETDYVLEEIRSHLRRAGIAVRSPR